MELRDLQVAEEGHALVLRLPGGELTARTARELDATLAGLVEDRSHRVVLVESDGRDFCTGAAPDLGSSSPDLDPPGRMEALRLPVVVAITGRCHSVGLEVALGGDVRVASEGSAFEYPELSNGALSRWGAVQRLTRAVGPSLATKLVLLGQSLDGGVAFASGLVHELAADPRARAREVAAELAARGPLALEYAKEAVRRGAELPLAHALRLEADFNHLLQVSGDRAEGLQAFFDKRAPRFEGR